MCLVICAGKHVQPGWRAEVSPSLAKVVVVQFCGFHTFLPFILYLKHRLYRIQSNGNLLCTLLLEIHGRQPYIWSDNFICKTVSPVKIEFGVFFLVFFGFFVCFVCLLGFFCLFWFGFGFLRVFLWCLFCLFVCFRDFFFYVQRAVMTFCMSSVAD